MAFVVGLTAPPVNGPPSLFLGRVSGDLGNTTKPDPTQALHPRSHVCSSGAVQDQWTRQQSDGFQHGLLPELFAGAGVQVVAGFRAQA
jgi:hypothetical protein